jgi:glycosyltransferase involved in cell wall biosynthesis
MAFATQGVGHGEEARIRDLTSGVDAELYPFDRKQKRKTFWDLLKTILSRRADLVVMEGTGLAGGAALLLGRFLARVPYVVSSGDAVGPFLSGRVPLLGPAFGLYERLLCRCSAGFIGWTPYLVGRALTFGAPRGMTAAGWAPFPKSSEESAAGRLRVRQRWGIPPDAIVFGIAGTLEWNRRVNYCYGLELVSAAVRIDRPDVRVLIVGDGSGRAKLEQLAAGRLGSSIILTGRVPREQVLDYLAAMDVGSLPQSVDGVGSFRYTTKISEYIAASLPLVTGQIPLSYDFDSGWLWRLPGRAPWDERYVAALADLMGTITAADIQRARQRIPSHDPAFDRDAQVARVTAFLNELLDAGR